MSLREGINRFLFLKKGYAFLRHLIPFLVASVLLLLLSLPKDDLLLELAAVLEKGGWLQLPAGLLTSGALVVYYFSLRSEIRRAYLWPTHDGARTLLTGLVFLSAATLLSLAVLSTATGDLLSPGKVWACLLVAALSLTGVGWKAPNSWVEDVGIELPDYRSTRRAADEVARIMQVVRSKPRADREDLDVLKRSLETLRKSLEANAPLEPRWARCRIEAAARRTRNLEDQIQSRFSAAKPEELAAVLRFQKEAQYGDLTQELRALADCWPEWQESTNDKERRVT